MIEDPQGLEAEVLGVPCASSIVRAQASAGSQPSYSPFQPCGAINPTCIRHSVMRCQRPARPQAVNGDGSAGEPAATRASRAAGRRPVREGPGRILATCPTGAEMTTEPTFDPDRAAGRSRRSMGLRADAELARRAAVPHDRHDRGRTGAGEADRRATCGSPVPAADLAAAIRAALTAGEPVVVTGCGTSEHARHGRGRDPARGGRGGRSRWLPAHERAGLRAGARAAGARPRDRRLARGSDPRDQRGAGQRRGPPARRPPSSPSAPAHRPRRWRGSSSRPASSITAGATRSAT